MFELLKNTHMGGLSGFAMTLSNGRRIEVDFGPLSESEGKNRTKKEFEHNMRSSNAEVRIYEDGQQRPYETLSNCTPEQFFGIYQAQGFVKS